MEDKETFTRSEVEDLLQTLHEEHIQVVRDHFEERRAINIWAARVVTAILAVGALGFLIIWMFS